MSKLIYNLKTEISKKEGASIFRRFEPKTKFLPDAPGGIGFSLTHSLNMPVHLSNQDNYYNVVLSKKGLMVGLSEQSKTPNSK